MKKDLVVRTIQIDHQYQELVKEIVTEYYTEANNLDRLPNTFNFQIEDKVLGVNKIKAVECNLVGNIKHFPLQVQHYINDNGDFVILTNNDSQNYTIDDYGNLTYQI